MKKILKNVVSLLLCAVMIFGSAPLEGFKDIHLPKGVFSNAIEKVSSWLDNLKLSSSASAAEIYETSDGLRYTLDENNRATIVGYIGNKTDIVLDKVDGHEIVSLGHGAFHYCSDIKSVKIPDGVTNIGDYAFFQCSSLTSVNIPYGVTSIGYAAFYQCSFTNIDIPNSVTFIGEHAFGYCWELKNLIIPDSVKSLGNYAVYYCWRLNSVTIGNGVTDIGEHAFDYCSRLSSVTLGRNVSNIGKNAFGDNYTIQEVYISDLEAWCNINFNDNLLSSPVGHSAKVYLNNELIENLTIPKTVSQIKYSAFYNWKYLKSVEIQYGTTSIGDSAFQACHGLTNIIIPNSVTSIGNSAFSGCTGLTNIIIPNSVTSIGDGAFGGCTGLTNIIIPNSVTSIGGGAFSRCTGLTNITIPNRVTRVGNYTFYECTGLKNIVFSSNLTSIGDSAFWKCTGLTNITLPNNVMSIGSSAFYGCTGITDLIIPNQVRTIGSNAFYGLNNIIYSENWYTTTMKGKGSPWGAKCANGYYDDDGFIYSDDTKTKICGISDTFTGDEIIIPEGITHIGSMAFYNCNNILKVSIPSSVIEIGINAFYGCTSLNEVNISNMESWCNIDFKNNCSNPIAYSGTFYLNGTTLTEVIIPDTVTSLKNYCFYNCLNLTSIAMTNDVTKVGDYAFYQCSELINVQLSENVNEIGKYAFFKCAKLTNLNFPSKITRINEDAFKYCGLIDVVLPDSVHLIGSNAFEYCKDLRSIVIPESVTDLGSSVFSGCESLISVKVPDNVTILYSSVFAGCSSLTSVIVPDNVTVLYSSVFAGCSSLTNVTLGSGITYIYGGLFANCTSLKNIVIPDNVTYLGGSSFAGCTQLTSVKLGNSVNSIKESLFEGCGNLKSVTLGNSITVIEKYAFKGCSMLSNITIPNGVTNIGYSAFYGCTSLVNITIPNTVTEIGSYAFENCSSLVSIRIPDSVTKIGNSVFERCTGLKSAIIGNGLDTIEKYAFEACYQLEKVIIGNHVTNIGESAFSSCTKLSNVEIPYNVKFIGQYAFGNVLNITYSYDWYYKVMGGQGGSPWGAKAVDAYVEGNLYYYDSTKELLLGCSPEASGPITIPDSVEEVGENCFYGCNKVESISFSGPIDFADTAVAGCENLKTIVAPYNSDDFGVVYTKPVTDSVVSTNAVVPGSKITIKDNTGILKCNTGAKGTYTVPDKITSISENAFANCTKVTVTIPGTVNLKHIGANAFMNSGNYNAWDKKGPLIVSDYIVEAKDTFSSFTLPDTIRGIADKAFSGCKSLAKFSCNSSSKLSFLGSKAFSGCADSLKSNFTLTNSLMHIGSDLFDTESQNGKKDTVALDGVLVSVSDDAESYDIPDGTTVIADGAFAGCSNLKSIVIPDSVVTIGNNAFNGCVSLESVSIGKNVKEIGDNAFRECISLEQIKIPASVDEIGAFAFYGCWSLKGFTVDSGNANYKSVSGVLMSGDGKTLIQYPAAKSYTDNYEIESGTFISDLAFYRCRNISNILFGDGIEFGNRNPLASCSAGYTLKGEKADYLFRDTKKTVLISVSQRLNKSGELTLPESVKEIGSYALSGFNKVTSIVIPETVMKIKDCAFERCTSLKMVTMSEEGELEDIGESAFYGCTCLTSITIPNTVEKIGKYAFKNCFNLNEVEFSKNSSSNYSTLNSIGDEAFCNCMCNTKDGICNKKILSLTDEEKDKIFFNYENYQSLVKPFNESVTVTENGLIYGLSDGLDNIENYLGDEINNISVYCAKGKRIGTGTTVTVKNNLDKSDDSNSIIYTAVVFGDVNGDGWYDGTDAVVVNLIANGMLTREQVGYAVYMAADCNHDGVIDNLDVEILEQAGLLLAKVDQTKSEEELQTDSNYVEYLNLIDQNPTVDEPSEEPGTDTTNLFTWLMNFIVKIFNYFKLHFAIIK